MQAGQPEKPTQKHPIDTTYGTERVEVLLVKFAGSAKPGLDPLGVDDLGLKKEPQVDA